MTTEQRRSAVFAALAQADRPVSATALAERFGVSQQIIVGDVALLRAGGAAILATARGYLIQRKPEGLLRRVACRHAAEAMEEELQIMVSSGCTVLDVVVEHPVYGQLTGTLQLANRNDVQQFIARADAARPLSLLTEGVHLHTLACPDEAAFQKAREKLAEAGFLLET